MSQIKNHQYRIVLKGDTVLRKSDKTRQSTLDAALKYLWTHPYRELTISELMAIAGSSRSAFYRYYEDLPAMMEHLLNELKEKVLAGTTPWFQGEGEPILLLKESLGNMVSATNMGPFYGPLQMLLP